MNASHPDRRLPALREPAAALVSAMAFALLLLTACATGNSSTTPTGQRYRCEQNIEFSVKFVDDSALIDSSRGNDVLFRDAGGQGEGQTVYSNAVVRAGVRPVCLIRCCRWWCDVGGIDAVNAIYSIADCARIDWATGLFDS